MNLRCPECCSEEAALIDRGTRLECGNCGAGFVRDEALVIVADAEAELCPAPPPQALFKFDRARALQSITDTDGALWPVNAYSDADELNDLAVTAQEAEIVTCVEPTQIVTCAAPAAHFDIYPKSVVEADPIVAVTLGKGPALLGRPRKLRERESEDPVSFTLRLLEEMVAEANRLVAAHCADSARLDRIAEYMNRPGPWNGGDVCEVVAMELRESGRALAEDAADAEPASSFAATLAGSKREAREASSRRYALVVVLDAANPEQAWEAFHGLVGGLEGGEEPECVYVGAPWQGIPADAEDLSTERLVLRMSVPGGKEDFVSTSTALRPCD